MPQAFIAMPFDPIFENVWKVIKEACTNAGFVSLRADEILQPGVIIDQILDQILKSDCVVGVLTGRNPNVYYEIGIAHGLNKPVILLHSNGIIVNLPFDIEHKRVIFYDPPNPQKAINEIQAQLEFVKEGLADKVSSERFLSNINYDANEINKICDQLKVEYGFPSLRLTGMELLLQGKGMTLIFETPYKEEIVVTLDSNGLITRSGKI